MPPAIGQNLDIPSFTDGYQVILHVKHQDSQVESFVFTYAGLIAANGINNHSIGICCNTLLQLNQSPDGLPVAYIHRGVLSQPTYEEAVGFVRKIKHASGQNYIIGGPKEASCWECSANKVVRFLPWEGATRVYHTNHPLANDDQSVYRTILGKIPEEKRPKNPDENSEIRFKALEKRFKDPSKAITVETAKEALCSRDDPQNPVCNIKPEKGPGGFTAGASIMVLSEPPVLHFAAGPPCVKPFHTYTFQK
jgi:hypothetical protein